jgi:hypothetical protein
VKGLLAKAGRVVDTSRMVVLSAGMITIASALPRAAEIPIDSKLHTNQRVTTSRMREAAMTTLKDSRHFVPNGALLRINSETHFQEVYRQLDQARQGGFLLVDEGRAKTYVRAYGLADAVIHRAVKKAQGIHSVPPSELAKKLADRTEQVSQTLADEVERISKTPIGQVVREFMTAIFVTIDEAQIDVDDDETALRNQQADRVFEVYEAGEPVGWYLNHETLKDTTTEKSIFVCGNGHENPDTDSGSCYSCSAPLTDANKKVAVLAR